MKEKEKFKEQSFKSSYFLRLITGDYNPFTPNVIVIKEDNIEYSRRNWHLISVDTQNLHFQSVTGVDVDKHLFGSSLVIKSTGNSSISIPGFWKKKAKEISDICLKQISENTQNVAANIIAGALSEAVAAVGAGSGGGVSVADELKKLKELFDSGVLTQEEFDEQKKKLMK